jgi:hypothetical protein
MKTKSSRVMKLGRLQMSKKYLVSGAGQSMGVPTADTFVQLLLRAQSVALQRKEKEKEPT